MAPVEKMAIVGGGRKGGLVGTVCGADPGGNTTEGAPISHIAFAMCCRAKDQRLPERALTRANWQLNVKRWPRGGPPWEALWMS